MNGFFFVLLFIIYYLATPGALITINIVLSNETPLVIRSGLMTYAIAVFMIIFSINLLSSRINLVARKPMKHLFQYLVENQMQFKCRLKTMSLIERLSGPDIGFYCLDLFPMNSYEFYLFVANSVKLYILLKTL